jgi:hypothetical protein
MQRFDVQNCGFMYEGDDMNFALTLLVGLMIVLLHDRSRRGNKPFEANECLMRKADESARDIR